MTAYGKRIERLFAEIVIYLEILDLAPEDDSLWKEYCAWKNLTERRAKILNNGS